MSAFEALLQRVPVADAARRDLRGRLLAPDRHYHGAAHVALLWERHLHFRAGLSAPAAPWDTLIACAIAYHDAVYDPRRRDNEAESAALWRATGAAVDAEGAAWVAATIEATADHLAARAEPGLGEEGWAVRLWVLDLDLTPIGESEAVFAENTMRLRREFAHLDEASWEARRLRLLSRLAAAPRMFRSEALAAVFEAQARANIARELAPRQGGRA